MMVGAILAAAMVATVSADDLSPSQRRLVELLTYVQVARERCGYLIDVDVLRLAAAHEAITFTSSAQLQARDEGFTAAGQKFEGMRRAVECAYALERYGPEGSEFKGLLERKAE